jgi:HK97 family phage major capsid protein
VIFTNELKKYLQEQCGMAADADEETVKKSVSEAMLADKLTPEKLKELTTAKATEAENKVRGMINEALNPITDTLAKLAAALEQKATPAPQTQTTTVEQTKQTQTATEMTNAQKAYVSGAMGTDGANAESPNVRLKAVVENYNSSTTAATWDKASNEHVRKAFGYAPVMSAQQGPGSRALDIPSDRTKAISGAWLKWMANRACAAKGKVIPQQYKMSELDRRLVEYAVHECKFIGPIGWDESAQEAPVWYDGSEKLRPEHIKSLLDDATSGGLEAVPIEYDDNYIITPLLMGELYPYVSIHNVTRRRIEATVFGNVNVNWENQEGSAISLFDTDGFISDFNTNIYAVTGSMEHGVDFVEDSPLAVGNVIQQLYGDAFRAEMDAVLAAGNGTNKPLGILNTLGVSATSTENGAGGAQTITDYENLMAAIDKQYIVPSLARKSAVFLGTHRSYWRAKTLKTAETATDQKRLLGTDDYHSYELLGHRYAINESMGNANIVFVCLDRYRLYRRAGYEVRVVTEDWELARKNLKGIVVRARYGGKMETASAMSKITAGQA